MTMTVKIQILERSKEQDYSIHEIVWLELLFVLFNSQKSI